MGKYKIRVVEYHDVEVNPETLVTVTEAAQITGMKKSGVIRAIERGVLTEIVDTEEGYRGRRLLRSECEAYARKRGSEAEGDDQPGEE